MAWIATILTIAGSALMSYKRIEAWLVWVVADALWVAAYWPKHDWAIVTLDTLFIAMHTYGYLKWRRASARVI